MDQSDNENTFFSSKGATVNLSVLLDNIPVNGELKVSVTLGDVGTRTIRILPEYITYLDAETTSGPIVGPCNCAKYCDVCNPQVDKQQPTSVPSSATSASARMDSNLPSGRGSELSAGSDNDALPSVADIIMMGKQMCLEPLDDDSDFEEPARPLTEADDKKERENAALLKAWLPQLEYIVNHPMDPEEIFKNGWHPLFLQKPVAKPPVQTETSDLESGENLDSAPKPERKGTPQMDAMRRGVNRIFPHRKRLDRLIPKEQRWSIGTAIKDPDEGQYPVDTIAKCGAGLEIKIYDKTRKLKPKTVKNVYRNRCMRQLARDAIRNNGTAKPCKKKNSSSKSDSGPTMPDEMDIPQVVSSSANTNNNLCQIISPDANGQTRVDTTKKDRPSENFSLISRVSYEQIRNNIRQEVFTKKKNSRRLKTYQTRCSKDDTPAESITPKPNEVINPDGQKPSTSTTRKDKKRLKTRAAADVTKSKASTPATLRKKKNREKSTKTNRTKVAVNDDFDELPQKIVNLQRQRRVLRDWTTAPLYVRKIGKDTKTNSGDSYFVETIKDIRFRSKGNKFLTKWRGWIEEFNSWVKEEDFHEVDDRGPLGLFFKQRRDEGSKRRILKVLDLPELCDSEVPEVYSIWFDKVKILKIRCGEKSR